MVIAGGTAGYVLIGVGLWLLLGNTTVKWAQIALVVVMGLVGVFLLIQCLVWMTAILSRVSVQTVLGDGFAPSVSRVTLRSSLQMFWPVLGLSLLQYVAASLIQTVVTFAYYLVVIPVTFAGGDDGLTVIAVSSLVSVLAFLLAALAYGYIALTVPALATEAKNAPGWIGKPLKPTNVITAFERSFRLIGLKNLARVTLVMAGAMLISLALICLLAIGAMALVALFASSINADLQTVLLNPWTIFGVLAFAVVVAMSALLAYVSAVQTLLYLDLRMRREGLDLALRFDCAPIPQPSAPPPPVYWPPAVSR